MNWGHPDAAEFLRQRGGHKTELHSPKNGVHEKSIT